MSWLSDFAKTALNEAQKRIDKVLDIEEDSITPINPSFASFEHDSSLSKPLETNNNGFFSSYNSPTIRQTGTSMVHNVSKKKGKPTKLGSSLTKQKIKKGKALPVTSKYDVNNQPSSTSLQSSQNSTTLLSTSTQKDCRNLNEELVESSPLEICHCPEEELKNVTGVAICTSSLLVTDINEIESVSSSHSQPDSSFKMNGVCANVPSKTTAIEANLSPCGSTTASSEIDILDHESTISEVFTASKMTEFDNHLCMLPSENDVVLHMSPDHIDSEASDIIHLSGYCTSPLSVDGCDNPSFNLREKSPVSFPESCDIDGTFPSLDQNVSCSVVKSNKEIASERSKGLSGKCEDFALKVLPISTESLKTDESESQCFSVHSSDKEMHNGGLFTSCLNIGASTMVNDPPSDTDENVDGIKNISEITVAKHIDTANLSEENGFDAANAIETFQESTLMKSNISSSSNSCEEDLFNTEDHQKSSSQHLSMNSEHPLPENIDEKSDIHEPQLVTKCLDNAKLDEESDNLRTEQNTVILAEERFEEENKTLLKTIEHLAEKLHGLEMKNSDQAEGILTMQIELSKRMSNDQVQLLLVEKEEMIQGLLQEGEVLSKKHLQQNNTIKKLRSKITEQEQTNKNLAEKNLLREEEIKSLTTQLTRIESQSFENRGTAERLSDAYQEKEFQLKDLRNRLEDAEENNRSAQATLDVVYKDLAELNKQLAAQQSEREAELEQNEAMVTKKMQQDIEKIEQDHEHQLHMHLLQIGELRDTIETTEVISLRKENQLRKEIEDLQQRLQDSDFRNHDLSNNISESTRPLLRQIESLQSTYFNQTKSWEALERSLTSRLSDVQMQFTASQDKERSLQMTLVELKSKLGAVEQQLSTEREEKATIKGELKELQSISSQNDEKIIKLEKEIELSEQTYEETKAKARRDRLTLGNQLDMEKIRFEADRQKFHSQLETAQKEKEHLLWMSRSQSVTSSASFFGTEVESATSPVDTFNNFDIFDRQASTPGTSIGVCDAARSRITDSALLENLQAHLKQRDGEITQLQDEIGTLERTRSSMAEEIVRLTSDNEDLVIIAEEVKDVKNNLKEMEARHEAALTMYGEKAEEAEELRMDLEDVKSMYRQQIDALLKSDPAT